jgi:hypothetical protein
MDYDKAAKYYAESGGVIGPPSAYDSCRTCHGSGLNVVCGGVECSTCKGTGKRPQPDDEPDGDDYADRAEWKARR